VLASGCRYVTNKVNTLTKIVSIEYKFFCDIYCFSRWSRGFIQFNGVIGVSKAPFLRRQVLMNGCPCEDLDISEKIYLSGNRALLAKTKVGEQSPTSVQDCTTKEFDGSAVLSRGFESILVQCSSLAFLP